MKIKILISFLLMFILTYPTRAQQLKPGFDKEEYIEMLKISAAFGDSTYVANFPKPKSHKFVYRSPVVGLDNRWDLWGDGTTAVISIRGTTANPVGWLANLYAAMAPAKGQLQLSDKDTFNYQLSEDPRAAVHVGWLVCMASLAKDILPKIDSSYKAGTRNMIIFGHSQGGAIGYLLTAYLYNLQKLHLLPADIRFKTYCSAGPKPGNLYFAYTYEALTQNGWAYNVVNASDWVPEVPMSIQTLHDYNYTNPFKNAKGMIKKQKFPKNLVLRYVFNRLDKPTRRAQRNYEKYLGRMVSKMINKSLPGYVPPAYFKSNNYVRTGNTIVLTGDSNYHKLYPDDDKNLFVHHFHPPYLYLAERLDFNSTKSGNITTTLNGSWELTYISGKRIAFEGLYPGKKPAVNIDLANYRINGNTSCNSFNGKLNTERNKISFTEPMAMTKMFCEGEGEQTFLEMLKTVTGYTINEANELNFLTGEVVVMKFKHS